MNEENKPAYYAIIPSEVRYCEELKFAERLLYGEITALAGKEGYCFATNRYFGELYHVIPGTISRWIKHLENLGLEEDEYVKEFKLVFDTEVKAGFEATTTPVVKAKVCEDVQNNKIFVNNTYVTALYQKTKLEAKDNAHTVVYTKTPDIDKELAKTGMDD